MNDGAAQKIVEAVGSNSELWGNFYQLVAVIFLIVFLRDSITAFVAGRLWQWSSEFNKRDIVKIENQWARVIHFGLTRTEFTYFTYDQNGQVNGGETRYIANDDLKKIDIRKPLGSVGVPTLPQHLAL